MSLEKVVSEPASVSSAEKSRSGWQRLVSKMWFRTGKFVLMVWSSQKFAISDAREIGQALIFLPAAAGELAALGGENLDQAAQHGNQVIAGAVLDERRNEIGVGLEKPRRRALHPRIRSAETPSRISF